jgi:tetratricopeptide (TPR) repeat protein
MNLAALPAAPIVPQTVYTLIQSRLERLSASARRILDAAAVVGREFDYEVAARAAALSNQAAIDVLEECQASQLIQPIDAYRYAFDHNLTMAVIHQETTAARRRLLHRHAAEALEKIHHDNPDVVAGTIALHYEQAGMREKAARYAFLAGKRAAKLAAWQEAIDFYKQALAGIEVSKRQEALLALGQAYLQEGRINRATAILREALVLAQKEADTDVENMAMQVLAESLLMQDYYEDVIDLAREIIDLGRPEMSTIGFALLGAALSQEGVSLAEAAAHLRRAESELRQRSDEQSLVLLAEVKFELGSVFAKQGDLPRAVKQYRAVLELVRVPEAETAWRWHILAYNNLAFHLHLLADPQADEIIQAGLALAREQGAITLLPFLLSTAGEIALAQGDSLTAEGYFREGLALAEQFDRPERIVGLTANLGLVARDRGQTAVAVERLSTALTKAGEIQNHYQATQIRLWLAPLLPESQALPLLEEARAMSEKGGYGRLLGEASQLTP